MTKKFGLAQLIAGASAMAITLTILWPLSAQQPRRPGTQPAAAAQAPAPGRGGQPATPDACGGRSNDAGSGLSGGRHENAGSARPSQGPGRAGASRARCWSSATGRRLRALVAAAGRQDASRRWARRPAPGPRRSSTTPPLSTRRTSSSTTPSSWPAPPGTFLDDPTDAGGHGRTAQGAPGLRARRQGPCGHPRGHATRTTAAAAADGRGRAAGAGAAGAAPGAPVAAPGASGGAGRGPCRRRPRGGRTCGGARGTRSRSGSSHRPPPGRRRHRSGPSSTR